MWWDIGGNIRSVAEYHVAGDMKNGFIADVETAAECHYHIAPPVASLWTPHGGIMADSHSYGYKYTGQYRICTTDKQGNTQVGEKWQGMFLGEDIQTKPVNPCELKPVNDEKGRQLTEHSPLYPVAALIAAPFDYAIDPALSLVTSPFALIYVIGLNLIP